MRKNKFLAALAIAACLATSIPLSANAATLGQAKDASKVVYGTVSDANKALLLGAFDAAYYAKENPDVVSAGYKTDAELFNHFVTAGIFEGRAMNANFNPSAYKSCYDDLAKTFKDDVVAYYIHYITNGSKAPENRKATVDAVTKAGYDVYSIIDGSKVADKYVAPAAPASSSSSDSSSSNPSNPGTVTPSSDEQDKKIAELEAKIKELEAKIANAKTDADKQAAEAAKEAVEKALEDIHNAQGYREDDAKNVAARFGELDKNVVTVAAGNAGEEIKKSVPVVSLTAIENGATEAIFMRNVWYDYSTGEFKTMKENSGKYEESVLYVKDDTKDNVYRFIDTRLPEDQRFLPDNWKKEKRASQTYLQLYKINGLTEETEHPYEVTISSRTKATDAAIDVAKLYTTSEDDNKIDGNGAFVSYKSPEGVRKLIVFDEKDFDALPSGVSTPNDRFSVLENVDGVYKENYLTKVDWDEYTGFNKKYFVQGEDGKWYVVVNERTTYHEQRGGWLYKNDNYGNQLYLWQPIHQNGELIKDYDGKLDMFVRYNTSAEFKNYVDSPYLRVDPDGHQYSTRFVAVNKNAAKILPYEAPDSDKRGLALQQKYFVREEEANRNSYDIASVTENSITGNSIGREYTAFADVSTWVKTKNRALVNAWILQHYYGSVAKAQADQKAKGVTNYDILHANEYYVLQKPTEGYVVLLSDAKGYTVEFAGYEADGTPKFYRVKDGVAVDYDDVRVREYAYTRDYKVACMQNTIHFSYATATSQYYVEPEYEGSIELYDGTPAAYDTAALLSDEVNHVAKSNDATDRWKQFDKVKVKLHPTYDGYNDKTWAGETGFEIQKSEYDGLLTKTLKKEFEGYVYVHVTAVYTWDQNVGANGEFVKDASFVEDRWYKKASNDRKDDLLYANDKYSFEKTEDETTGATLVEGGYGVGKYVEVTVDTLAEAFDLAQNKYGIFGLVQAKENGRFYVVRK